MLSRRSFLLGTAGAVLAGGGAVELYGRDRVLHRVGLSTSPDHRAPPSGWDVTEGRLPSGTRWALSRPPGGIAGIIVCLHGRGDDRRFAFDQVHLHDAVAEVGAPFGVASLDGGPDSYWHRRADGTDAGAVVVDELLPLLRTELFVERFAVLGWSMGGYGALLLGERHPELLPVVVAASPALFTGYADAMPGAFDSARDYAANDVFAGASALDPAKVRIDCGTHDPFEASARRFAERLGPRATATFRSGYHDAAFWRSVAPAQVRFVSRALS